MDVYAYGLVFSAGLALGSFLNVVIYRVPQHLSVILPGSHCPHCGAAIPWKYKIPVISYLWLKGRCRYCGQTISWQYPIVELLGGVVTVLLFHFYGWSGQFLFFETLALGLIAIAFIDWQYQIIPDVILIGLLTCGLLENFLLHVMPWKSAFYGAFLAMFFMIGVAGMGRFMFRREAMGMGDIKLAFVLGFFLGHRLILYVLFFSFWVAFVIVAILLALRRVRKDDMVPLAPFLAIASFIFLFWGKSLVQWYWHLFL